MGGIGTGRKSVSSDIIQRAWVLLTNQTFDPQNKVLCYSFILEPWMSRSEYGSIAYDLILIEMD